MKKRLEPTVTTSSHSDADWPTTEHNYRDRFVAYARSHGNQWFVIRSDRAQSGLITPAPWLAWMEGFFRHNIPVEVAKVHGVMTVPSEWPEQFDSQAEPSDRNARFPAKAMASPEQKAETRRRFAALIAKLSSCYDPARPNNPTPPPETAEARLLRLAKHSHATPLPPLSEAARAGAGLSAEGG